MPYFTEQERQVSDYFSEHDNQKDSDAKNIIDYLFDAIPSLSCTRAMSALEKAKCMIGSCCYLSRPSGDNSKDTISASE